MKTSWAKFFALILFMISTPVLAEEYIRSFHSVIDVGEDGKLTVTETITVNVEGNRFQRGLVRDFPLYRMGDNGRRQKVDFEVLGVERNGAPEDWHTEGVSGGIRIYTGSQDRMLRRGEHSFQITYQTGRQFFFAEDYDDLTWNVTGNGWDFRIGEVSATVVLPLGSRAIDTRIYTGALGSTASDGRVTIEDNEVYFSSTRIFNPREGMTIAVKLPKGVIAPPTSDEEMAWWLADNMSTIIAVLSGLGIFAYYFVSWSRVGRDPPSGVVVPRWDIPGGLSPALVNYVENKGFRGEGWEAFSAAVLNLAVKGYLTLEDLKKNITFQRTPKPIEGQLHAGERALIHEVEKHGGTLTIDKSNGEAVKKAGENFRRAIEAEHRGKYYQHNSGYVTFGILASVAAIIMTCIYLPSEDDFVMILSLGIMLGVAFFFMRIALSLGRRLVGQGSLFKKLHAVVMLGMMLMVGFSLLKGMFWAGTESFETIENVPTFVGLGIIIMANVIFVALMGAPTEIGQKLSEGVAGLKTYLNLAEKDRMNMQGAPQMSPQHYETLLPYAVALGLEKNWTNAFNTWLATATAATAAAYAPGWYAGDGFGNFGDRVGGFASNMSSTIQSTIPAPPPSSSGSFSSGGGFSGGGGGGGGGGGW